MLHAAGIQGGRPRPAAGGSGRQASRLGGVCGSSTSPEKCPRRRRRGMWCRQQPPSQRERTLQAAAVAPQRATGFALQRRRRRRKRREEQGPGRRQPQLWRRRRRRARDLDARVPGGPAAASRLARGRLRLHPDDFWISNSVGARHESQIETLADPRQEVQSLTVRMHSSHFPSRAVTADAGPHKPAPHV